MPARAARAFNVRCKPSGTLRSWIIFDMLLTYFNVHHMSTWRALTYIPGIRSTAYEGCKVQASRLHPFCLSKLLLSVSASLGVSRGCGRRAHGFLSRRQVWHVCPLGTLFSRQRGGFLADHETASWGHLRGRVSRAAAALQSHQIRPQLFHRSGARGRSAI